MSGDDLGRIVAHPPRLWGGHPALPNSQLPSQPWTDPCGVMLRRSWTFERCASWLRWARANEMEPLDAPEPTGCRRARVA